jgi:hypothetical protein
MTVRAIFAALVVACGLLSGCCTRSGAGTPPPLRFCNGQRLAAEFGWFYADLQDTIFGVDYYYYMDHEFDANPYD